MSPDYDPVLCSKVDVSQCKTTTEGFTNMSVSSCIPTILALVGLLYFTNK